MKYTIIKVTNIGQALIPPISLYVGGVDLIQKSISLCEKNYAKRFYTENVLKVAIEMIELNYSEYNLYIEEI